MCIFIILQYVIFVKYILYFSAAYDILSMEGAPMKLVITKNKNESVNFSVRTTKEVLDRFDELSKLTNRTRNELVNMALQFSLEHMEIKDD